MACGDYSGRIAEYNRALSGLLAAAHAGILFRPPANVSAEFPQFPVTKSYDELRAEIIKASRSA